VSGIRDGDLAVLAGWLGLPVAAFDWFAGRIGVVEVGADPLTGCRVPKKFALPEEDGAGRICGVQTRDADGNKLMSVGSGRGLTVPTGWRQQQGPLLLVEGASDVFALASLGIPAIGRPSNIGGSEQLKRLLSDPSDAAREIIVLGENDRKADGRWPGRDGAKKIADALVHDGKERVSIAFPPEPHKDARAWVRSLDAEPDSAVKRAAILSHLVATAKAVKPKPPSQAALVPGLSEHDAPDSPNRLAALFLARFLTPDPATGTDHISLLRRWLSDWWVWSNGAYRLQTDESIEDAVWKHCRETFLQDSALAAGDEDRDTSKPAPQALKVSAALVNNVWRAIRSQVAIQNLQDRSPHNRRSRTKPIEFPAWINGNEGRTDNPTPTLVVSFPNGLFDLKSQRLMPPSPNFFTLNSLDFEYDGKATSPSRWLEFLRSVWPNDQQSIDTLQEFMGYLLTGSVAYQKMLFLLGPTRSGKGTILAILERLVGESNHAAMALSELTESFGLSNLLGKRLAVFSDVRISGSKNEGQALERLLSITSGDSVPVNRKGKDYLSVRLPTRIVFASNEFPRISDTSNAIVGRMLILRMTNSFIGRERVGLVDELLAELPAIFNWAVEGWARLSARGSFVQPETAASLIREAEDASSPLHAFVREKCQVGPEFTTSRAELYESYRDYMQDMRYEKYLPIHQFAKLLRAVVPGLEDYRPRDGTNRTRCYKGVGCNNSIEL
jgi:P4 family phage/plasmid primase-like protien